MRNLLVTSDALLDGSVLGRRVEHCVWCQHMRGIWDDRSTHTSTGVVIADVSAQLLLLGVDVDARDMLGICSHTAG
jgi:hypothetical protein